PPPCARCAALPNGCTTALHNTCTNARPERRMKGGMLPARRPPSSEVAMRRSRTYEVLLLVGCAAIVTGCGGDGDDSDGEGSASGQGAGAAGPGPEPLGCGEEEVKPSAEAPPGTPGDVPEGVYY